MDTAIPGNEDYVPEMAPVKYTNDDPTFFPNAFLLKKALQLSQVMAPKLKPRALSPHTAQTLPAFIPPELLEEEPPSSSLKHVIWN